MAIEFDSLRPARDVLFFEKNASEAWRLLEPLVDKPPTVPQMKQALFELAGMTLRRLGRFSQATQYYREIQDYYQAGYCELLQGNMNGVQSLWTRLIQLRPNHWCISLHGLITRQLKTYPSIFQIRNHLESDMANFIQAGRQEYVDSLVSYADILAQLNMEAPKFMGRAFLNQALAYIETQASVLEDPLKNPNVQLWLEHSGQLLLKGQRVLPNDPEAYYHLGQYKALIRQPSDARLMLKQCLLISPYYTPARELLERLSERS